MDKTGPNSNERLMIYQVFPRILTNTTDTCIPHGSIEQNGCGKMNDFTTEVLTGIKSLGVNCIWYTGIIEHATKTSFAEYGIAGDNPYIVKGEAGSPYAIKDYYDVAPALAVDVPQRMKEFEALVERTHRCGMKAIIDFVPNHTARCYHSDSAPAGVPDIGATDDKEKAFSPYNNYYYLPGLRLSPSFSLGEGEECYEEYPAKATGNDCFSHCCSELDWYETVKLNYGRDYSCGRDCFNPIPDTWHKMLDIVLFWASKGVDGFRCDMVFMVPREFWHWMISQVKAVYPHIIFIGEIYDPAIYRDFLGYCGFDYLYDKVGLYDTLVGVTRGVLPASSITQCWQSLDGIADRMVNFLENHDEVRLASTEFAGDPINMLPALVVSTMLGRSPFLLYYGQELGVDGEENEGFAGNNHRSTIFDYWSYDAMRRWYDGGNCDTVRLTPQERWLRAAYAQVIRLCNSREELREGAMFDLTYANIDNPRFSADREFAFLRYSGSDILLIAVNFSDSERYTEINIPPYAFELLNIPSGIVETVDLLSGHRKSSVISPDEKYRLLLPAHGAAVVSFNTDNILNTSNKQIH